MGKDKKHYLWGCCQCGHIQKLIETKQSCEAGENCSRWQTPVIKEGWYGTKTEELPPPHDRCGNCQHMRDFATEQEEKTKKLEQKAISNSNKRIQELINGINRLVSVRDRQEEGTFEHLTAAYNVMQAAEAAYNESLTLEAARLYNHHRGHIVRSIPADSPNYPIAIAALATKYRDVLAAQTRFQTAHSRIRSDYTSMLAAYQAAQQRQGVERREMMEYPAPSSSTVQPSSSGGRGGRRKGKEKRKPD